MLKFGIFKNLKNTKTIATNLINKSYSNYIYNSSKLLI